MTKGPAKGLDSTLQELEHHGGRAIARGSGDVCLVIRVSRQRSNESVVSGVVSYVGLMLADGTPLQSASPPVPLDYDPLEKTGVRQELRSRGWKADRARLLNDWRIRGDADRRRLRDDVDRVLVAIGADEKGEFEYTSPGGDAGLGQVGCLVNVVAAFVGALLGVVVLTLTVASFNLGAGLIGLVAGWLGSMYAGDPLLTVAVRIPRLRPDAENLVMVADGLASLILAASTTVLLGLIWSAGVNG